MDTKRCKILVLSDLKISSESLINSTVNFAKRVNGNLDFFHVKKPADIVRDDNQLNAIRSIKEEHKLTEKQLSDLTSSISKDVNVTYSFAFGNIKNEIEAYIEKNKPDVIILGKRRLKALGLVGDKITRFVLKKYSGAIFITSEENTLSLDGELVLGVFNSLDNSSELEDQLVKDQVVKYTFETQDDTLKKMVESLPKSNVNLFCIHRKDTINGRLIKKKEIEYMINKCTTPLLITG